MTDPPLLECVGVSKRYGGVRAVRNVSVSLAEGEIIGLVGPNGAGKTTLVDLICGVQAADSGEIRVRGKRLTGAPSRRAHRGHLARTFQHPLLARELTVRENILVGLTSHQLSGIGRITRSMFVGLFDPRIPNEDHANRRVEEVCEELHLGGLERGCSELTLGELRLVEVARALMQNPAVLLLDEPFAGSDPDGVQGVSHALRQILGRGCGIILVDHNVDIVALLVDRIVLMALGAVAFDGPTKLCLSSPEMREVYLGTRVMAQ